MGYELTTCNGFLHHLTMLFFISHLQAMDLKISRKGLYQAMLAVGAADYGMQMEQMMAYCPKIQKELLDSLKVSLPCILIPQHCLSM